MTQIEQWQRAGEREAGTLDWWERWTAGGSETPEPESWLSRKLTRAGWWVLGVAAVVFIGGALLSRVRRRISGEG